MSREILREKGTTEERENKRSKFYGVNKIPIRAKNLFLRVSKRRRPKG